MGREAVFDVPGNLALKRNIYNKKYDLHNVTHILRAGEVRTGEVSEPQVQTHKSGMVHVEHAKPQQLSIKISVLLAFSNSQMSVRDETSKITPDSRWTEEGVHRERV